MNVEMWEEIKKTASISSSDFMNNFSKTSVSYMENCLFDRNLLNEKNDIGRKVQYKILNTKNRHLNNDLYHEYFFERKVYLVDSETVKKFISVILVNFSNK